MMLSKRMLGKSNPKSNTLGLGCWAIGGPFFSGKGCAYPIGQPLGWGDVDDKVSVKAIHCALEHDITFFDTADAYGTGHSEKVLGRALKHTNKEVVIATKFGNVYNSQTRELHGSDITSGYIRNACDASLKRLDVDKIDLYQIHLGDLSVASALEVAETLEELCAIKKIGAYGWSTDDPERAIAFGKLPNAVSIQHDMNVFQPAREMLDVCNANGLISINRSPLAMGFLAGKFDKNSKLHCHDIRANPPMWLPYFRKGGAATTQWSQRFDSIRDILTSEGRTPVQGALAWIWATNQNAVPIPGFRTPRQVKENAEAVEFGPLREQNVRDLDEIVCTF